MWTTTKSACLTVLYFLGALASPNWAQPADPADAIIEEIRGLSSISPADQQRIAEWIQGRLEDLVKAPGETKPAALTAFVGRVQAQISKPSNSPAFRVQFATQAARIAATEFAKPELDATAAWGLSRILLDINAAETLPGLLACLEGKADIARFLCARGLTNLRDGLAKDNKEKQNLQALIQAIQAAGLAESSPVVLSHLYRALSFTPPPPEAISAFFSIFDKRLAYRRSPGVAADGAELEAWEYFRAPSVLGSLSAEQKAQLAQRVAVFLRLDAERYNTDVLDAREMGRLEMSLEAGEGLLAAISGAAATIGDDLAKGSHDKRMEVLGHVYRLIGDPNTKTAGTLNAAPWNVPLGAP